MKRWLLLVTLTSPGGLMVVGNKIRGWLKGSVEENGDGEARGRQRREKNAMVRGKE